MPNFTITFARNTAVMSHVLLYYSREVYCFLLRT